MTTKRWSTTASLRCRWIATLFAGTIWLGEFPDAAAAAPRFLAVYQSGKRLEGDEVRGWHDTQSEPRLDSQKLFVPTDRLLWIEDRSIRPRIEPQAFVEYGNGDCVPGRVIEFRTGRESAYRQLPPHFLFAPGVPIEAPGPNGMSISARWLRRVVWEKGEDDRYRPGTLLYRDGRQVSFRSLRWSGASVRLLLEQEAREIPFGEIAEIHLLPGDSWDSWLEQLALLAPTGEETLLQVESFDGLRLTTSRERFLAKGRDAGNPDLWFHGFQPAWGLEPLWLPYRSVRLRRFFAPHQPLLTLFEPARAVQRAALGGERAWQRDRSVQRMPLVSGAQSFGWGLGVHAYSELTFEVPPFVREFSALYGLDQAAGGGGCVRAAVDAGPADGAPLHRSPVVVGSSRVYETGSLRLAGGEKGSRQLTLVVDPLNEGRPSGADPFDIRDMFDWLQPKLEVDPVAQRIEVLKRVHRTVPAWQGWSLHGSETGPAVVVNALDSTRPQLPCFVTHVAPRETSLWLSRTLEVGPEQRYLLVAVNRPEQGRGSSRIEVLIEGNRVAEYDVPAQQGPLEPDPLLVPLDLWQRKTVDVRIVQSAADPGASLEWRGLGVVAHDPMRSLVFEEFTAEAFLESLSAGSATARFSPDDRFGDSPSLEVDGGGREVTELPSGGLTVRENPRVGEYRFLRFAWKKRGAGRIALRLAHDGGWAQPDDRNPKTAYRYFAGRRDASGFESGYKAADRAPAEWTVVTRDLFADFGEFELTGLGFDADERGAALFSRIRVARRREGLDP